MADLVVRKVEVYGRNFMGMRRHFEGRRGVIKEMRRAGRSGVAYWTNLGTVYGRIDDVRDVKLEPSLNPDAHRQTFVAEPVLREATRIVGRILDKSRDPDARFHHYLLESALLDTDHLPFGLIPTDAMYFAQAPRGEKWKKTELVPFQEFPISPGAVVLNYGQGLFEGLKALRTAMGNIVLFRPRENARRAIEGARRMVLNPVPEEYFLEAVTKTALANQDWIPRLGKGALYIRPLLIGTAPRLGVHPAEVNTFIVFVSPVGPYFKGGLKTIKLLVEDEFRRACIGGTGGVKVIGNYAASLFAKERALASPEPYAEVIYLDVVTGENVEEVGAANAFFVKGKRLYTPRLSGSILPGITRDSVIRIARDSGLEVIDDQDVSIKFAMACDEAFCAGTAAVISPIGSITRGKRKRTFNKGEVGEISRRLYETLTGIQTQRIPDPYKWVKVIG